MASKESIVITDEKGNPIQPEQPPNHPQRIEATTTQRTNTIEIMVYEGGISILEELMTMAANQFRQVTVGRDLPPGAENCI